MDSQAFEARIEDIKRRAHGNWTDILHTLGVESSILNKRNQPCPLCGGIDRFQYTDKYGEGNYHCRGCGPGGGLKLLRGVCGWDFGTTLKRLDECLDNVPACLPRQLAEPAPEQMKKLAKRLWDEARPVTAGDDVDRYLRHRGLFLSEYPKVLRFHSALGYYKKDDAGKSHKIAEYPAMLACIQGIDGRAVTLHRTYLEDGRKVANLDAKKVLSAGIHGAAIRLFAATEELSISEGIETALAVHMRTGKPAWAAIHAGNLEKLWIPASVKHICIYADNDAHTEYEGQACAFALARRLAKENKTTVSRQVDVFVPRHPGTDWADVWRSRQDSVDKAA